MGSFRRLHRKHAVSRPHRSLLARLCRFEALESRQLLSVTAAPIHLGAVYFEDSSPNDHVGNVFEITFNGGAAGTQLTELRINTDKSGDGLGMGDTFFDTAAGGLGAFGSSPFAVVSQNGIDSVTAEVVDGGTQLVLKFTGFDAGEKFVFSIDVDEQGFLEPNAVAEGAEFEGSQLSADFTAPHYLQTTGSDIFFDAFDSKLAGWGLNLPNDDYDPPSPYMPPGSEPGPVYTAGAAIPLQQVPLPITLAGTVFEDFNVDNHRQDGEPGIGGVHLALYELVNGDYVATGNTAVTDAGGNYKFDGLLPSTYRVVETQPDGYFSVGATAGSVGGVTRGVVTSVDVFSSINLDGGDDSIHNDFAETKPAQLSGHVYHDANNNGIMDAGEEGIGGVHLVVANASTSIDAYTADDGAWSVTGLMPGQYKVTEFQPEGYFDGLDAAGSAGGTAHNPGDLIDGVYLSSGQSGVNYDFGELMPAQLRGHVYHDANNNGVMDDGEEGIGGVHLVVANASTSIDAYTADDGAWSVTGLMPGQYKVTEFQPEGYFDGLDAAGSAGGTAHNPGDLIDGVYLSSGQSGVNYDFGELMPGCISGYVYADANNNGVFDEGETPLVGVQLTLLDASGKPTGETRVTDEAGYYRFCGLTPGVYGVSEAQPAGYYDGLDTVGTSGGTAHNPGDLIDLIPLGSGVRSQNNNFGELPPASIRGQVFADLNDDGVMDAGDNPLAGVTVYLLSSANKRIASTTTDVNGKYVFVDLKPGVYGVEEIQPDGYLQGSDRAGSAGGVLDGSDRILNAALGSGVNGINYDFWELVPAKISGYVFQDGPAIVIQEGDPAPDIAALRDGKLTPDDKLLSGVELQLCDGTGVPLLDSAGHPITTVTDANGYYEFDALRSGMYSIVEIQPSGYLQGVDTAGTSGGLVIDRFAKVDPEKEKLYAVDPNGSAIVQIWLAPGDSAAEYNFSEVLVETTPPDTPPIVPPYSPPAYPSEPPGPIPPALYGPAPPWGHEYYALPKINVPSMAGGSGGPGGYSWHLSIIDAGQPRRAGSGEEFVQYPQETLFDPVSWNGADLTQSQFILADQDGVPIRTVRFGMPGATPVAGDWDGSGTTKLGVFIGGLWFLDLDGNGTWDAADLWAKLGKKADQAVSGDWNGDGKTDIGIFGPAWIGDLKAVSVEPGLPDAQNLLPTARPKNVPPQPAEATVGWRTMKKTHAGRMRSDLIDHVFEYGTKGDRAVTGDWNGDGIYTIAIFRNGVWFLDLDGDGRWSDGDVMVEFGREGDLPVAGDWNGDGITKLGIYRNGTFYLDTNNNRQLDATDKVFQLGNPGDLPVAGDWNGDGVDEVGVYQQAAAANVQTASSGGSAAAAVK